MGKKLDIDVQAFLLELEHVALEIANAECSEEEKKQKVRLKRGIIGDTSTKRRST